MKRSSIAPFLFALAACGSNPPPNQLPVTSPAPAEPAAPSEPAAAAQPPAQPRTNPFFAESSLPYHLPPFDKIEDSDYMPAFEKGMAEQLDEVKQIAQSTEAPTFDNTIVALERTGRTLTRVSKVFFNLLSSNGSEAMQKVEAEITPKLSAHRDAILLDAALFKRVDAVYQQRAKLGLDPESAQLLDRYERMFVRAGAKLSDADKATLAQLNQDLSSLGTTFRQRVLAATKDGAVVVENEKQLAGLSPEQISAAAEAAKARNLAGKWVLTLQNTTTQPVLEQLTDRELRKRVFEASVQRARGGDNDTTEVVTKILALRAQKAKLLGYKDYAAYALAEETAGKPANVDRILRQVAPPALKMAKQEAADIQKAIDAEAKAAKTKPFKLEPWDWAMYAQKVRAQRFGYDDSQVKPYFELDRVLKDGVFFAANQLYGITFTERKDLPRYQPDVRVFEVKDADGSTLALILLDYYKRDAKQGGAWMDTFVDQSSLFGEKPVVVNNLNIPKPAPGQPTLLTFDEVETMFHEFGHLLHGVFSNVKYPLLSGTNVPPDFVEFPSQFNEMWLRDPKVLANIAKHYKTGEAMPKDLLDKVLASQTYGTGYGTLEYLEAAMLDLSWHEIPAAKLPKPEAVISTEEKILKQDGVAYAPVPPRYHSTYFQHIFSGGYEAGYYAYMWSEILARDSGAWFTAHGGLTRQNGDTFRAKILSRGRTKEPDVLFKDFYGKAPDIKPLLEYRGLVPAKKK
ncbi:MAG TPA: M3 family metallopeptidase [Kofleriaceae bacterium]|nr:M3 family metallopeptidase [Kofleriaceae bacterium]